jgi:hypothetical protein
MLAWVVMIRRYSRRASPEHSPLRPLFLCVTLSDSFPPSFLHVSHLPYLLPSSVSRNPFVCHSYENGRGVYQQFPFWNDFTTGEPSLNVQTFKFVDVSACFRPISFFFKHVLTLLHSREIQLISFQAVPHSLSKTTRGGGCPSDFAVQSKDACATHCARY